MRRRGRSTRRTVDTRVSLAVGRRLGIEASQRVFPVVGPAGALVGLVSFDDVRKVPQSTWSETHVSELMVPAEQIVTMRADAPADRAIQILARRAVDQVPVLDERRPVGLVRSPDVLRRLSLDGDEHGGRPRMGTT